MARQLDSLMRDDGIVFVPGDRVIVARSLVYTDDVTPVGMLGTIVSLDEGSRLPVILRLDGDGDVTGYSLDEIEIVTPMPDPTDSEEIEEWLG